MGVVYAFTGTPAAILFSFLTGVAAMIPFLALPTVMVAALLVLIQGKMVRGMPEYCHWLPRLSSLPTISSDRHYRWNNQDAVSLGASRHTWRGGEFGVARALPRASHHGGVAYAMEMWSNTETVSALHRKNEIAS